MKNYCTLLIWLSFMILIPNTIFSQAPEKFSYQAIVRDASNVLLTGQNVSIRISINIGSPTGSTVYSETHAATTNVNGLVSLEIGSGVIISGSLSGVSWGGNDHFVTTEIDPFGGSSFTIVGSTQLISVPYALHANTADSVIGGVTITELDPVFSGSVASGISNSDVSNWNSKLSTEIDGSITNEIQIISLNADTLILSNGGYVVLPVSFDGQYSSLTGAPSNISSFVNDAGYISTEIDGSILNEIQTISRSGSVVTLSNGGGSYVDSSISYTAGQGISITSNVIEENVFQIGDFVEGGIVFWLDETGEHGLVCSKDDQSTGIRWSAGTLGSTYAIGSGPYSGEMNTTIIMSSSIAVGNDGGSFAAKLCSGLQITEGSYTYGDWYLPSPEELTLMTSNYSVINATSLANGGSIISTGDYWSSKENDANTAFTVNISTGFQTFVTKSLTFFGVRAIRAF